MADRIIIFDLCGTLYDSNTTFDFLDKYQALFGKRYRLFRKISRTLPWKAFNKVLFRLLGLDLTRVLFVKYLKGFRKEELSVMASGFVQELASRKINFTHQLLRNAMQGNSRVILLSASLDFIVEAAARELGIREAFSTSLSYSGDGNVCSGIIINDLLAKKKDIFRLLGVDLGAATVITDNLTDADMVASAAEAIIISKKKNVQFWAKFKTVNDIYVID